MTFNKFAEELTRGRARARISGTPRLSLFLSRYPCPANPTVELNRRVGAFDKVPADKTDKLIRRGKSRSFPPSTILAAALIQREQPSRELFQDARELDRLAF